jgi:hypothetical protein
MSLKNLLINSKQTTFNNSVFINSAESKKIINKTIRAYKRYYNLCLLRSFFDNLPDNKFYIPKKPINSFIFRYSLLFLD